MNSASASPKSALSWSRLTLALNSLFQRFNVHLVPNGLMNDFGEFFILEAIIKTLKFIIYGNFAARFVSAAFIVAELRHAKGIIICIIVGLDGAPSFVCQRSTVMTLLINDSTFNILEMCNLCDERWQFIIAFRDADTCLGPPKVELFARDGVNLHLVGVLQFGSLRVIISDKVSFVSSNFVLLPRHRTTKTVDRLSSQFSSNHRLPRDCAPQ